MKKFLAVLIVPVLMLTACTTTPSVQDANAAACTAIQTYVTAVSSLKQLDQTATIEQYKTAATAVDTAYSGVTTAMVAVTDAKIDTVKMAQEDLQSAVKAVPETTPVNQIMVTLQPQLLALETAIKGLNDSLKCTPAQ